jgi:serine/threonine-protein kinase
MQSYPLPTDIPAEPIPGYRLVRPRGKGGFGEVWEAVGPGGFPVALKFVHLGCKVGESELRSLDIIKGIRHAHLLATFGAWQLADHLIIAMELADKTLLDRLQESIAEAHQGIPGPELREYMWEAAKGLDYLNEPRHCWDGQERAGIQHRDIKPQNLLLVGGTVKVADFGLARVLEGILASHSGGLTPAYAAPEFFEERTTHWSDQYSLAVTYCHLRGGRLPFTGNLAALMAGHLSKEPDLTMLPEEERAAVARALAKNPDKRWPSCQEFVKALGVSVSHDESARSTPREVILPTAQNPSDVTHPIASDPERLKRRRHDGLSGEASSPSGAIPVQQSTRSPRSEGTIGQAANRFVRFHIVMTIVTLIIMAIFFFAFFLPQWNKAQRDFEQSNKEFQKKWNGVPGK